MLLIKIVFVYVITKMNFNVRVYFFSIIINYFDIYTNKLKKIDLQCSIFILHVNY